jgi:hypothetical protein
VVLPWIARLARSLSSSANVGEYAFLNFMEGFLVYSAILRFDCFSADWNATTDDRIELAG